MFLDQQVQHSAHCLAFRVSLLKILLLLLPLLTLSGLCDPLLRLCPYLCGIGGSLRGIGCVLLLDLLINAIPV